MFPKYLGIDECTKESKKSSDEGGQWASNTHYDADEEPVVEMP